MDDGSENAELVPALAENFTVVNYARRAADAESPNRSRTRIEDIEVLIAEAGGWAHLFGASTGGALVLEAAMDGIVASSKASHTQSTRRYWFLCWNNSS